MLRVYLSKNLFYLADYFQSIDIDHFN